MSTKMDEQYLGEQMLNPGDEDIVHRVNEWSWSGLAIYIHKLTLAFASSAHLKTC
jgi:hypothetical protein